MGVRAFQRSLWLGLLAVFAAGVLAAPAHAFEVLPVTSVSPADGATIPLPTEGIRFEIQSPIVFNSPECTGQPYIDVSSRNVLDEIPGSPQEGQLAKDFLVDFFQAVPSQAYPGLLSGVSNYDPNVHLWYSMPGTYYWQVQGNCAVGFRYYISRVYTLIIAPPPPASQPTAPAPTSSPLQPTPPNLTVAQAKAALKSRIRARSHHNAYHLHAKCRLTSAQEVTCKATWFTAQHIRASTTVYSGTFEINSDYERPIVTFTGVRALSGCVARHLHSGSSRCYTRVNWH